MRWSYKVTFWDQEITARKKGKTYTVRWTVEGEKHRAPFHAKSAANNFESELRIAHRNGERFDIDSGLPQSKLTQHNEIRWFDFTLRYTEARWPHIGGRQRQSIAEGLSDATLAMLASASQRPTDDEIRAALKEWAFGDRLRGLEVGEEHKVTIAWLEENTVLMTALEDEESGPALVRGLLDHLSSKQDGTKASANYFKRRRSTVNTAMKYAVETRAMRANPIGSVSWKIERSDDTVDPAVVPNQEQIKRLLSAVGKRYDLGARLETFFAVMAYAGLRPEEVIALRKGDFELPGEDAPQAFGEFRLRRAETFAKARYNDDGKRRDRRRLKHRSEKTVRNVPIHPRLVKRIRAHVDQFGYGIDGRLFVGPKGAAPTPETYSRVWSDARRTALSAEELERGLAAVPYNLRHACVSSWLAAVGDPAQVAEWAGHSIDTLLGTYAKCLDGSAKRALKLILDSMPAEDPDEADEQGEEDDEGGEKF